ncbi:MAG: hypothetical protein E7165_01960 [Firmicutes bacterium]|nr:hypothetical protein [Bacillota bacterium]
MDFIFEIIGEILFEGLFEIIKNKNINKWIRYPIITIIICFYLFIIGIFLYLGFDLLKNNILISMVIFLIVIFLIIAIIIVTKKHLR